MYHLIIFPPPHKCVHSLLPSPPPFDMNIASNQHEGHQRQSSIPTSLPNLLSASSAAPPSNQSGEGCCHDHHHHHSATPAPPQQQQAQSSSGCCSGHHKAVAKDPQATMKAKILSIQGNQALTPKEKAVSVQKIMMQPWTAAQALSSPQSVTASMVEIEQARKQVTFHNPETRALGCEHYQRGCKLYAECCKKWYTCRFCHDAAEDHVYDRYSTKTISCMSCATIQPVASHCVNERCGVEFAHYYCGNCKFYDNDKTKDIYHCDKCNICRIGKGLGIDYFHCDKCNACMSVTLRDHKCVERSLESDCPICHTFMFTSTTPVMFLPCGHCMHVKCYEEYTLTNYVCPICSKSLGDMRQYFGRIDELMAQERMPDEYANHCAEVFCCDCERKSSTKFHFIYHKCQYPDCGSYNTKVMRQFQVEPGQDLEMFDPSTPRAPALTTLLEYE